MVVIDEIRRLLVLAKVPIPAGASPNAVRSGRAVLAREIRRVADRMRDDLARAGVQPPAPEWTVWDRVSSAAALAESDFDQAVGFLQAAADGR